MLESMSIFDGFALDETIKFLALHYWTTLRPKTVCHRQGIEPVLILQQSSTTCYRTAAFGSLL